MGSSSRINDTPVYVVTGLVLGVIVLLVTFFLVLQAANVFGVSEMQAFGFAITSAVAVGVFAANQFFNYYVQ